MDIQGLQKMTLLDWPGKVACTVFLGGCDFRCPFCHNSELLSGPMPILMDQEGLLEFLRKRQGLLDGVCVTGGEPLLRPGLQGLVDYVAMDVKNSPERYPETVGVPGLDLTPVRDSVAWLLEGHVEYEFRTTAVRQLHDAASFQAIGRWLQGARRYYIQNFVDRDTVLRAGLSGFEKAELEAFTSLVRPFVERVEVRGV